MGAFPCPRCQVGQLILKRKEHWNRQKTACLYGCSLDVCTYAIAFAELSEMTDEIYASLVTKEIQRKKAKDAAPPLPRDDPHAPSYFTLEVVEDHIRLLTFIEPASLPNDDQKWFLGVEELGRLLLLLQQSPEVVSAAANEAKQQAEIRLKTRAN